MMSVVAVYHDFLLQVDRPVKHSRLTCGVALQFIGNPDFIDNNDFNGNNNYNDNSIFGAGSDVSSDFNNPFFYNDIPPQTGVPNSC